MKLTNRWNRLVYRLWSPVYDELFDRYFATMGRKRAMEVLAPQAGEFILIAGVGTGADLPLLPKGVKALGVDLSPEMLARSAVRLPIEDRQIFLVQGDAQKLPVRAGLCDAALLNLVLSVVPDGALCLKETLRALKPGARVVIFDKFVPEGSSLSLGRKFLNSFTMLVGTDITRKFSDLAQGTECQILHNEPSLLKGTYRVMVIRK